MNTKKHHWILYLISFTILATIAVQVFWNYKNYQQNKQRVLNEIQVSLDNAIEEYFSGLAKNNYLTIVNADGGKNNASFINSISFDSVFNTLRTKDQFKKTSTKKGSSKFKLKNIVINSNQKKNSKQVDSLFLEIENTQPHRLEVQKKINYYTGKKAADSIKLVKSLHPIVISILDTSIDYKKVDSLLTKQLGKKRIEVAYSFNHLKNDSIFFSTSDTLLQHNFFEIESKSTFLKNNERFKLLFNNPSIEALKRSLTGISLSLLLSLAIISCLFYLLHIINKQKELAEIKNDLISNITHEFKTPITTASAAIEAIRSFNAISDQEKTEKYLSVSTSQLKKLTIMVEKLLETATLGSEQLLLKKENTDIVALVQKAALKEEFITVKKNIAFHSSKEEIYVNIDSFHFENAISNLIDNAIKYGGDNIEVHISTVLNTIEISVADDGKSIEKNQREKIFEQFYRIPKGNTHDVKGFGIGLYYSKKIIEKHGGQINLVPNTASTIFKISMPL